MGKGGRKRDYAYLGGGGVVCAPLEKNINFSKTWPSMKFSFQKV